MYHEEINGKSQCQNKGYMAWGWWPTLTRTKANWDGQRSDRGRGDKLPNPIYSAAPLKSKEQQQDALCLRYRVQPFLSSCCLHTLSDSGDHPSSRHTSRAFIPPELDNIVKWISQDAEHGATAILLKTLAPLNRMTCKFQIPGWSCVRNFCFSGWINHKLIS